MSQSDQKKTSEPTEPPFDGFDDVAESITEVHHHPAVSTSYRPGTGRRLATLAVALVIVLGGGFIFVNSTKQADQQQLAAATDARVKAPPVVEVITVGPAPPGQVLRLPGETKGWYASTIFARVSGYVLTWKVDIGDRVQKNQTLAEIDTPELDAQLEAAKAQLVASEAETKVREADAEFAKTTYDRWAGSAKGVVSEQEREDKKANYAVAVARLNAARAQVSLNQSNVTRLIYMTQFKKVTAPYDGVITERRIDIGDLVTAGSTSSTAPLFGIAQYDQIRVFTNVPQSASLDIGVGTVARIYANEHADRVFEGKVARTSQSIDPQARTLRVEVDLPNKELTLLPGMYVQVEFRLAPAQYVQIPASALLFTTRGPQVALIQQDNTVKFQDIRIGRDNGNVIEVASGLSVGDRVALNISNQIADGERVTVRENDKMASK